MVLESVPLDSETMRTVYPIRAYGFGLFYAAAIPHYYCDGERLSDADRHQYSMEDD